ncbi:hypothetical protein V2H45_12320 [Tumidithrix elongata RA019]|uniref:Uncharacterized protein n=1 Tax=Tumidithrix elongata BACA0141 TaxID=2716417 RepID=A0AAW9Q2T4_9CYAN|nr:hypothetical protein [Tumidithrix elongata RA019]
MRQLVAPKIHSDRLAMEHLLLRSRGGTGMELISLFRWEFCLQLLHQPTN